MGYLRSTFGLLLSLSFALSASAQEPTTARLDFQTEVESCMPATRFGDEVSARVGRVVFADDATHEVRVRVTRGENEVVVTVTTNASEEHVQGRSRRFSTRTFRDPSCDEALEAAAASVAVWVDEAPVFGVGGLGDVPSDPVEPPRAVFGMHDDGLVIVRASSNWPELTFHLETNTGYGEVAARFFERLCVMPCEARIRRGVQQFGIAVGNGVAHALPELTQLEEDSELFVDVRRASGWNIAGRYLFFVGLVLVAPSAITATAAKADDWGKGMLWASIGISAGLVVGGTLMFSLADGGGIEVSVRPLQR